MKVEDIEKVLLEQQDELETLKSERLIHRPEEKLINLNSNLAQVVIGVRRSGKSTLCVNALNAAGVTFAYTNFDDERLEKLSADDLDTVLQLLYKIYGPFDYLFLDEIQNIDGWPLFVNRLLRQKIHLIVTGSNAKLLSGELATHLTGRHHKIELYPFSFKDWCDIHGTDYSRMTTKNMGLVSREYAEYIKQGGFPELFSGEENPKEYIGTLVDNIITNDIVRRYHIRNDDALKKLVNLLLDESPGFVVKDKLQKALEIKSDKTVAKYIGYLTQAYLISTISKYSRKSRERARNEKYYAIDVAFMDRRDNAFSGENLGWRLETVVYVELLRRKAMTSQDIYYYKESSSEADFVICDGNNTLAIYQVCHNMSLPKTRKREIRGCIAAARGTGCHNLFIITDSESETIEEQGYTIQVMPVWKWLVQI